MYGYFGGDRTVCCLQQRVNNFHILLYGSTSKSVTPYPQFPHSPESHQLWQLYGDSRKRTKDQLLQHTVSQWGLGHLDTEQSSQNRACRCAIRGHITMTPIPVQTTMLPPPNS
ncbi:hypothetical protein TNCV_2604061 [Trichonephila clavipes]|nr:hypothetical protein TNCV_2604061 [Trichonephila clavipes]